MTGLALCLHVDSILSIVIPDPPGSMDSLRDHAQADHGRKKVRAAFFTRRRCSEKI
jgi:hypothetical protein